MPKQRYCHPFRNTTTLLSAKRVQHRSNPYFEVPPTTQYAAGARKRCCCFSLPVLTSTTQGRRSLVQCLVRSRYFASCLLVCAFSCVVFIALRHCFVFLYSAAFSFFLFTPSTLPLGNLITFSRISDYFRFTIKLSSFSEIILQASASHHFIAFYELKKGTGYPKSFFVLI